MKSFSIKIKLIIIFILIKIIPLLIIVFIAYEGVIKLDEYLQNSTRFLFNQSKEIIINTANESINDSVRNLDKKSQRALERESYSIAKHVASFLYQRDDDIRFLSKLDINNEILRDFYKTKIRPIIVHDKYYYDEESSSWSTNKNIKTTKEIQKANLVDNEKEFNYINPLDLDRKFIPIYKEVSFFDLAGNEKYKVSQINENLLDISNKKNTYISSETYFNELKNLKEGDIYVSDVIGEYVGTKVIGKFTKEKAKKSKIEFEPEKYAYAGKENPVGKKFEGIIRFVTAVYKEGRKIGYLSLALDHKHIMQFTDTVNPTDLHVRQDIADASIGNYAFMWDYEGRNISHPRDYFITGYNKETGEPQTPWLSPEIMKKQKKSNLSMNEFLKEYPTFDNQTLKKKANIKQLLEDGNVGLDCRYLNFAPQCQGWMQVTKDGGYGSFVIYWSKVWKLTTAASIPYFTGQYGKTKRGFGFVTIGANVDEFHAAANETRLNVNKILNNQTKNIKEIVEENEFQINKFIKELINELSIVTTIMIILIIIIALWLSAYISRKIEKLLIGTNKFSNNELDYRIEETSKDEIGKLEKSFNTMASKIENLIKHEKQLNESLEYKVEEGIKKHRKQEQLLIQQSKLASMGEMIGNIAHQWRQPLNALSLVIQNIHFSYQMDELDDEFMDKSVAKANLLTNNMSKTIDDFRNFFKPNKSKDVFELNNLIKNSIELVNTAFKHHQIELVINFDNKDIYIEGYPNEFSQALVNILNNAKDVFLEMDINNAKIVINTYVKDSFAVVDIEDNGSGIDKDLIEKVFDPYFTTKEEGQGIGIGLYMTKTIIEKNMNGKLTVQNNKVSGATFTIKIPISNKKNRVNDEKDK